MPNLHDPHVIAPSVADFYCLIAERAPAMLAVLAADERLVFANPAFAEPLSCEASSLLGRTVRDVVGAANYAEISPKIRKALRGDSVSYVRGRFFGLDTQAGQRSQMQIKLQPVFDSTHKVVYVIVGATVVDVADVV
jgi:PAS domain S-box-containing protein